MRRRLIFGATVAALVASACGAASAPTWSFGPAGTQPLTPSTVPATPVVTESALPTTAPGPVSTTASVPPEVAGCGKASTDPLAPVLQVSHGDTGLLLLVGLSEDRYRDPPMGDKVFLFACRWERTTDGVQVTDGRGVTVLAEAPPSVSVDFGMQAGLDSQELVVGGRAARPVAAVRLVLADRSVVEGEVSNGYWAAWWQGELMTFTVTALDASGTVLSTTPIDPMATPTLEPGG